MSKNILHPLTRFKTYEHTYVSIKISVCTVFLKTYHVQTWQTSMLLNTLLPRYNSSQELKQSYSIMGETELHHNLLWQPIFLLLIVVQWLNCIFLEFGRMPNRTMTGNKHLPLPSHCCTFIPTLYMHTWTMHAVWYITFQELRCQHVVL